MYPPKRPSQIPDGFLNGADQPEPNRSNTWLVQRFITSGIGSDNSFGKGNFLYVCLAALVDLQLSTLPSYVPHIDKYGLQSEVVLEYYGEYPWSNEGPSALSADPSMTWARLRKNIDEERTTLRWINRFFRKNFDCSNKDIRAAFDETMECFKLRVQDLEQAESWLRDHLAVKGTSESIQMAEMSIRESKRVMLRMYNSTSDPISLLTVPSDGFGIHFLTGLSRIFSIRNGKYLGPCSSALSLTVSVECAADQQYWPFDQSLCNHGCCNVCIFCDAVGGFRCFAITQSPSAIQKKVGQQYENTQVA